MTANTPPKVDPTAEIWIGEKSLFIFIVFMMVLGSLILLPTAYVRWRHRRIMEPEVIFIVLGYAFFLAHEIVLLSLQPLVYRLSYVALGMKPYYKEIMAERHNVVVLANVSTYLFYATLWCIKISLLLFFRQFMSALPEQLRWWKMALGYLILTYIFGFLVTLLSCGGPHQLGQTTKKYCQSHIDGITRNLSLFGWFAADVSTDLLIMILPLRLVFAMHISHAQKIRAGALFSVGMLCMITAIIRLVQIGSKTGVTNPNVQWFSLWGTVEATTAMVVGCLPTFRLLFKARPGKTPPNYSLKVPPFNSDSSSKPPPSFNDRQGKANSGIHLNIISSRRSSRHLSRGDKITASTENLAPSGRAADPPAHL
ncbi:uncharacterized protein GIQ15_01619 [Arthroderma uncinatum]|uniref:uncharacterized protein n=1 Tax=Arthroderma uncinatum TaxID=74035 RepID=UPI00144AD756|nr:uncharacterized protein GIQ15_01619 [Arthroderma uncinatum]KAF3492102.1 hypothetical protein GIQ15_01619 [Arthroderma uncinatum]